MSKVFAFVADGMEETECLAAIDVLFRGGIEVKLVSVMGRADIVTAHGIRLKADAVFEEVDCKEADVLLLPGGMPGTLHLGAHKGLAQALLDAAAEGRRTAAICAAPSVLGQLGILKGRKATCYPGFEDQLDGAEYTRQGVVTDGTVTTSRGLGYALDFGLEILKLLTDEKMASEVKAAIQYDQY